MARRAGASRARHVSEPGVGGALYTLPAWGLLFVFVLTPVAWSVYLALRSQTLAGGAKDEFVGLANFTAAFTNDQFWDAARVTLVLTVVGLVIQMAAGLLLALLLHRALAGTRIVRSVLLLPMLLTPVAVGLIWRFMFNSDLGVIDWLLGRVHLPALDWLGDTHLALAAVAIVDAWQNVPFIMLMLLAGLQSLPSSPYEAAAVDGASAVQQFVHVTIPMLRPVLLIVVLIRCIESIKLFDILYIITQGGPGTSTTNLSILTYRTAFTSLQTSYAAAMGVVLMALTLPLYFLWRKAADA